MSWEACKAVIDHSKGKPGEVLLLVVLANSADKHGFVRFRSDREREATALAQEARCKRSSVYNYLNRCEERGEIVRTPSARKNLPAEIRITLPGLETEEELGQGTFLDEDGRPLAREGLKGEDGQTRPENARVQNMDSVENSASETRVQNLDIHGDGQSSPCSVDGTVQIGGLHIDNTILKHKNARAGEREATASPPASPDGQAATPPPISESRRGGDPLDALIDWVTSGSGDPPIYDPADVTLIGKAALEAVHALTQAPPMPFRRGPGVLRREILRTESRKMSSDERAACQRRALRLCAAAGIDPPDALTLHQDAA